MLSLMSLMMALAGVFTPVLTIYLIWFSSLTAGIAGLTGSLVFSAIAILINIINLVFLSPISLALVGGNFFSMLITLFVFIVSLSLWGLGIKLKMSNLLDISNNKSSQSKNKQTSSHHAENL
jgi:hypothetical protein